jgi:hypothetical protein
LILDFRSSILPVEVQPMARILRPPQPLIVDRWVPSVFLAGSIEMGTAENWQVCVERELADTNAIVLNPRRAEWDASWVQSIDNAQFRQQVEWELAAQEQATWIAMYIAPATQAPITLLELGLAARSGKLIVCCPDGYWRKGNVDIVCHRYGIPQAANLEELITAILERIES